jgi:nucleoside 2-deoxyribosyltransferase
MGDKPYKIYCAGPLFNPKEREEMQEIASVLEGAGYSVFLPHRDGLEFAFLFPSLLQRSVAPQQATEILNRAIFSLDVFQIADSDGLVLNMNGRVPDEGAMVEAGIAWACKKVIVIFRNDSRSLIEGNCNPMALGLADFSVVTTLDDVLQTISAKISSAAEDIILSREPHFDATAKNGRQISQFLAARRQAPDIAGLLIDLFGERKCQTSSETKGSCSQANTPQ